MFDLIPIPMHYSPRWNMTFLGISPEFVKRVHLDAIILGWNAIKTYFIIFYAFSAHSLIYTLRWYLTHREHSKTKAPKFVCIKWNSSSSISVSPFTTRSGQPPFSTTRCHRNQTKHRRHTYNILLFAPLLFSRYLWHNGIPCSSHPRHTIYDMRQNAASCPRTPAYGTSMRVTFSKEANQLIFELPHKSGNFKWWMLRQTFAQSITVSKDEKKKTSIERKILS